MNIGYICHLSPFRLQEMAGLCVIGTVIKALRQLFGSLETELRLQKGKSAHLLFFNAADLIHVKMQIASWFSELPRALREELFKKGSWMLEDNCDLLLVFWHILYSPDYRQVVIPCFFLDSKPLRQQKQTRLRFLNLLRMFRSSAEGVYFDNVMRGIDHMERNLLREVLKNFTNVTLLRLWAVCNDDLLTVIGRCCPLLETLDIRRSIAVTDNGVAGLCGRTTARVTQVFMSLKKVVNSAACRMGTKNTDSQPINELNKCCDSLKYINIELTRVSPVGIRILLLHVKFLEKIKVESPKFVSFLEASCKENGMESYSVKELEFGLSSIDPLKQGVLCTAVKVFPRLEKLVLAPCEMSDDLKAAGSFHSLTSLSLHHVQFAEITPALHQIGSQLRNFECAWSTQTVDLRILSKTCSNIEKLKVWKSVISGLNKDGDFIPFSKLRAVKFGEVGTLRLCHLKAIFPNIVKLKISRTTLLSPYTDNIDWSLFAQLNDLSLHNVHYTPNTIWQEILFHGHNLKKVAMLNPPSELTDSCLVDILHKNSFLNLERFLLVGEVSLTSSSIYLLLKACSNLQLLGKASNWDVENWDALKTKIKSDYGWHEVQKNDYLKKNFHL